jgi:adenine phosphoribosyltransferase
MDLEKYIRDIPDFPTKGIIFKDITPLLADPGALDEAVRRLAEPYEGTGVECVAAVESRGFIFGAAVARQLGAGFVPIRKPGKLPHETVSKEYSLEYGTDAVEIHTDAVSPGSKVLMIDDLLATGGTMAAACELVASLGGRIVGIAFLIELGFLNGRAKLPGYDLHTLIRVE